MADEDKKNPPRCPKCGAEMIEEDYGVGKGWECPYDPESASF